jgi:hypothetical protein
MPMHKQCEVSECDREATIGGLCSPCYQGLYYWMKKTPTGVIKRSKQLRVLKSRLDLLSGAQRPSNTRSK